MKIRLDELSWPEVQERLTKPHAVILPLGSTEEHGAHLPLNVDSATATMDLHRQQVNMDGNNKTLKSVWG